MKATDKIDILCSIPLYIYINRILHVNIVNENKFYSQHHREIVIDEKSNKYLTGMSIFVAILSVRPIIIIDSCKWCICFVNAQVLYIYFH